MKPLKRLPASDAFPECVVWDIETVNWFDVVSVAALHSSGRYIIARTIPQLMRAAIRAGWVRKGVSWYSHYGGRFDNLLWLRDLLPEWSLDRGMYQSGFGIWFANMSCHGDLFLELRDSQRLLPGSVASIGRSVGLPKLDVDRAHIGDYSAAQIREYNLRDCEIVMRGLRALWSVLKVPGDTLPARVTKKLRAGIPLDAWGWDEVGDARDYAACYGGHTEVYQTTLENGACWDINSSYPAAMCGPLPTRCIGESKRWSGKPAIVDCTVTVPECEYPMLPFKPAVGKWKGSIMHGIGTWRATYAAPELEYALQCGARIERVHSVRYFTTERWLEPFMRGAYERRAVSKAAAKAAQAAGDDGAYQRHSFDAYAQKILLNSVYGKTVEHPEHEHWIANGDLQIADIPWRTIRTHRGPLPMARVETTEAGSFRHAAVGAYILARGRVALHRAIVETRAAYCDTDSVYCADDLQPGNTTKTGELGKFQHETDFNRAEFLAPKVYAYWKDGGNWAETSVKRPKISCRAKGFGIPSGWTPARLWDAIKAREPIPSEQTRSFVAQYNAGVLEPVRDLTYRVFGNSNRAAKRRFKRDGSSVPWTMTEILP